MKSYSNQLPNDNRPRLRFFILLFLLLIHIALTIYMIYDNSKQPKSCSVNISGTDSAASEPTRVETGEERNSRSTMFFGNN